MTTLFKFCPNCGSTNHTFTNGKHFACKQCSFDYFHNSAAACAVILVYNEAILFTVRNQEPGLGGLDLPGGFIDRNESLEEGLRREVKEELGITLAEVQYLTSFPNTYPYNMTIYHTCDAVFVGQLTSLPAAFQADEIQSLALIHPRDINLQNIPFPSIRNAVQYYLEHRAK